MSLECKIRTINNLKIYGEHVYSARQYVYLNGKILLKLFARINK